MTSPQRIFSSPKSFWKKTKTPGCLEVYLGHRLQLKTFGYNHFNIIFTLTVVWKNIFRYFRADKVKDRKGYLFMVIVNWKLIVCSSSKVSQLLTHGTILPGPWNKLYLSILPVIKKGGIDWDILLYTVNTIACPNKRISLVKM